MIPQVSSRFPDPARIPRFSCKDAGAGWNFNRVVDAPETAAAGAAAHDGVVVTHGIAREGSRQLVGISPPTTDPFLRKTRLSISIGELSANAAERGRTAGDCVFLFDRFDCGGRASRSRPIDEPVTTVSYSGAQDRLWTSG